MNRRKFLEKIGASAMVITAGSLFAPKPRRNKYQDGDIINSLQVVDDNSQLVARMDCVAIDVNGKLRSIPIYTLE